MEGCNGQSGGQLNRACYVHIYRYIYIDIERERERTFQQVTIIKKPGSSWYIHIMAFRPTFLWPGLGLSGPHVVLFYFAAGRAKREMILHF